MYVSQHLSIARLLTLVLALRYLHMCHCEAHGHLGSHQLRTLGPCAGRGSRLCVSGDMVRCLMS